MSEGGGHEHAHEDTTPKPSRFRFEAFADAAGAQAAFEAVHPPGSPIEPALQMLANMGAHCRAVSPTTFACRYIETERGLARFCWHVVVDSNGEKRVTRVGMAVTTLGI